MYESKEIFDNDFRRNENTCGRWPTDSRSDILITAAIISTWTRHHPDHQHLPLHPRRLLRQHSELDYRQKLPSKQSLPSLSRPSFLFLRLPQDFAKLLAQPWLELPVLLVSSLPPLSSFVPRPLFVV